MKKIVASLILSFFVLMGKTQVLDHSYHIGKMYSVVDKDTIYSKDTGFVVFTKKGDTAFVKFSIRNKDLEFYAKSFQNKHAHNDGSTGTVFLIEDPKTKQEFGFELEHLNGTLRKIYVAGDVGTNIFEIWN